MVYLFSAFKKHNHYKWCAAMLSYKCSRYRLLMLKNRKINWPWWSVSSFVCSQESWFQVFLLLKWLALTAFPLHFILQGLFIFLIYGVYNTEVSLLGVSQGCQTEWEKWQVSYLDNWGTKLAFHMSALLPFMLGLAYMHLNLLLNTDTLDKGTASFLTGID